MVSFIFVGINFSELSDKNLLTMVPKISSVVIRFCFDEHFDFMYGLQIKSTKLDFNEYGFDNSI